MEPLYVIKIGGNIIDNDALLRAFLQEFAKLEGHKILVHGGGKLATQLAAELHIPQQMIEGRRVTDAASLKVVTMVYAGFINKNIVALLQAYGCNAVGISGADGNAVLAHKRKNTGIDYGFAGDVDMVNSSFLAGLLHNGNTIVMAPITHDGTGQLLNTNADTIAQETARAMTKQYEVQLIFSFEKPGVLLDAADDSTVITSLHPAYYAALKQEQKIFAGMIPKLDNAFAALQSGVKKVIIGKAENLQQLISGQSGTTIIND